METYEWKRGTFKNLSLRVLPGGRVRVTSPWHVPKIFVDRFVTLKAAWIEERRRLLGREPDSVFLWGRKLRVRVVSPGRLPRVVADFATEELLVRVPATWEAAQKRKVLESWEKDTLRAALEELIPAWEERTGLKAARWSVKRLRSRWGSCQPETRRLVFNSRLAAFPKLCLEYVVVHELAHLVEASHNARFHSLVEGWFPEAKAARALLNPNGRKVAADESFAG